VVVLDRGQCSRENVLDRRIQPLTATVTLGAVPPHVSGQAAGKILEDTVYSGPTMLAEDSIFLTASFQRATPQAVYPFAIILSSEDRTPVSMS
jgi:hypothetical protein